MLSFISIIVTGSSVAKRCSQAINYILFSNLWFRPNKYNQSFTDTNIFKIWKWLHIQKVANNMNRCDGVTALSR